MCDARGALPQFAPITSVACCATEPHDTAVTTGTRCEALRTRARAPSLGGRASDGVVQCDCAVWHHARGVEAVHQVQGARLLGCASCAVLVPAAAAAHPRRSPHPGTGRLRRDGTLLLAGSESSVVKVFTASSRTLLRSLKGHKRCGCPPPPPPLLGHAHRAHTARHARTGRCMPPCSPLTMCTLCRRPTTAPWHTGTCPRAASWPACGATRWVQSAAMLRDAVLSR